MADQHAMVENFRSKYREQIEPGYSPWFHAGIVFTTGFLVIGYALMQLETVHWYQYLTVPITLVIVNFLEYVAHRWLGHKKTKILKLFYQRHTGDHHTFYIEDMMAYQTMQDWRVVFFPIYLIYLFLFGLVIPWVVILSTLFSDNVAYLFAAASIFGYLLYEFMHFSFHLSPGSFVERTPIWRDLREHHVLHHQRDLMGKYNFNITLPLFDWLLGTKYRP